jgi:hypothetical protein
MATISQVGHYRHGMYGYPVLVELEPEDGEPPVNLAGATAVGLTLQRVNPITDSVVTRDLGTGVITEPGGGLTNPIITWLVLEDDIPLKGQYEMVLTIDFGSTQRFIADGKFAVS